MVSNHGTGKLRGFRAYFPKALKFFDLKDDRLAPIVFSIVLFANLLGIFLQGPTDGSDIADKIAPSTIPLYILMNIITKLALSVYLAACIKEMKGEVYSLKSCVDLVLKRSLRILAASVVYTLFTTVLIVILTLSGLFYLAIPILVIYIMYQFNTCYIVDRNYGIIASFKASRKVTSGYKWRIFVLTLIFTVVLIFISMMILGVFVTSGSALIYSFVIYFMLSLFNMMNEKLIALLYYDLEYGAFEIEKKLKDDEF